MLRLATLIVGFCLLVCLLTARVHANSEMREWTMKNGNHLQAEIRSVDEKNRILLLRDNDGKEHSYSLDDLGLIDYAWVMEWLDIYDELLAKVKELGGKLERHEGKGEKFKSGYFVYHPSGDIDTSKPRPLLFLIDPSGNAMRYVLRHMEAAEKAKITILSADYFRNGITIKDCVNHFNDLIPVIIKDVAFDPQRLYLGGTSGGAWGAFEVAARIKDRKVAGIYSNVGWLDSDSDANGNFPACRVALVNGDKDIAAKQSLDSVTNFLHSRKCTVSLFAFEGGHQVPPVSVQLKSFRWLLGETQ